MNLIFIQKLHYPWSLVCCHATKHGISWTLVGHNMQCGLQRRGIFAIRIKIDQMYWKKAKGIDLYLVKGWPMFLCKLTAQQIRSIHANERKIPNRLSVGGMISWFTLKAHLCLLNYWVCNQDLFTSTVATLFVTCSLSSCHLIGRQTLTTNSTHC